MTLGGSDRNAFNAMGLFAGHARRHGWPPAELLNREVFDTSLEAKILIER